MKAKGDFKILASIPVDNRPQPSGRSPGARSVYYDFATKLIEAYKKGEGLNVGMEDGDALDKRIKQGSMRHHILYRLRQIEPDHEYRVRVQTNADRKSVFVWVERIK